MPTRPKPPCPRCHHMRCICVPAEERPKRVRGGRRVERPKARTAAEKRRRKATVDAWLAENQCGRFEGKVLAVCPECHRQRTAWVADHIHPVALGGDESGPLKVHCRSCSNVQGAQIANMLARMRDSRSR